MRQTKQQKLSDIEETIKERREYLATIERDIEAVTTAGNNQLLIIRGEIEMAEREKAQLLGQNYYWEQKLRENKRLAEM